MINIAMDEWAVCNQWDISNFYVSNATAVRCRTLKIKLNHSYIVISVCGLLMKWNFV